MKDDAEFMYTPKNTDEYLDLLDQAIYDAEELLMCAGDEGEAYDYDFSEIVPVIEQLVRELKKLHAEVKAGTHAFANDTDLAFMPLVRHYGSRIPFRTLLEALNTAHKAGFGA